MADDGVVGTDDDWDQAHQATLMSVVRLVRLTLPWLVQSSVSRIVNISSTAAQEVLPGRLFSATYRSALAAMAKHLSVEVAAHGVTVNVIAPGNILTPDWDEAAARQTASLIPLGVWAPPGRWERCAPTSAPLTPPISPVRRS